MTGLTAFIMGLIIGFGVFTEGCTLKGLDHKDLKIDEIVVEDIVNAEK